MEQLLLTLDYIHRRRIVHRDIKLDNILINQVEEGEEFHIKIADFGLSDFIKSGSGLLYSACGTPSYIAPELLRGTGYNTKCDIFSLGSVLYNLKTQRYLFSSKRKDQVIIKNTICDLSHIEPHLEQMPPLLSRFIKSLLTIEPELRPSAREALSHEWFDNDREVIAALLRANDNLIK